MELKAQFHLPGLFEFYEFYKVFLPLYKERREYFYPWCSIASIYGSPANCLWGGGRVGYGEDEPSKVLSLMKEYGISPRLTFSNSLLKEEHLKDKACNKLCKLFSGQNTGVILYSELLHKYLKENYDFYYVSSTTKVITEEEKLIEELNKDFCFVVPDYRFNNKWNTLETLKNKHKMEFLCNEACPPCISRKACYRNVSLKTLGLKEKDFPCPNIGTKSGYSFRKAMRREHFISIESIRDEYLPRGFTNFKIEGRSLGSAMLLEFLLYYLVKREYHIDVREELYLDSMLDLF